MKTLPFILAILILLSFSCNKQEDKAPDIPFVVEPSGTVYVAGNNYITNRYYMYALNASTGDVKWKVQVFGGVTSTPTMAGAKLYFKQGFELCSIDTANPTTYTLVHNTRSQYNGTPLLYNNVLYYKDNYAEYGYDVNTNNIVMTVNSGAQPNDTYSSGTAANGILYTVTGSLSAIQLSTKTRLWSNILGTSPYSSCAVSNGLVYVGLSGRPSLYALDALTGDTRWHYDLNNVLNSLVEVASSPTIHNGAVYFGATDSIFYALNATTGQLLWKSNITHTYIHSDPIAINNTVFFCSKDFYALNASTGELKWKTVLPSTAFTNSPVYANGVIYIPCSRGELAALDANTGTILWNTLLGNYFNDVVNPIVSDKNKIVYHPGNSGEQQ